MSNDRACLALVVVAIALSTLLEPAVADPVKAGKIAKIGYLSPVSREQQAPYAGAFVQARPVSTSRCCIRCTWISGSMASRQCRRFPA